MRKGLLFDRAVRAQRPSSTWMTAARPKRRRAFRPTRTRAARTRPAARTARYARPSNVATGIRPDARKR